MQAGVGFARNSGWPPAIAGAAVAGPCPARWIRNLARLLAGGALILGASPLAAQTLTLSTFAGQAGQRGAVDAAGGAARFSGPRGLALDSEGNLYVADTGNHVIRRINATGAVTTLAGTPGQSGSADGFTTAARFNAPTSLAVDSAGNVYVADTGNGLIRQITNFGYVATLPLAGLLEPAAIAIDRAGNGYVADRLLHIIGTTTPTGVQNVLAGSPGRRGSADGAGGTARFNTPSGVAVNSAGVVFVLDNDNGTVRRISPDGITSTLAGAALQGGYSDGTGAAARFLLRQTTGIAVDAAGNLLVADEGNHVIRRVSPAGLVSTLAGLGGTAGSTDGTAQAARLNGPGGLVLDRSGNVYISDTGNHTIRIGRAATVAPYPALVAQPLSLTVNGGDRVALAASATGATPLAYQWRKDGVALAGATEAQLQFASVAGAQAGAYDVVVTNSAGAATSEGAVLTVTSGGTARIANLSVRTSLAASQTLTVGFATNGARTMLLRALGPALAAFGVGGLHQDPAITLYDSAGLRVDGNDNWDASLATAFAGVGAFPLPAASKDAALQRAITGSGTAQINGPGAGLVLVEAYDAGGAAANRFVNVSSRNFVGTGDNILIAGLYVEGTVARTLLIRGIGPTLAGFGVTNALADPRLEILDSTGRKIAENDNWNGALATVFPTAGAFALAAGSRDAALLITLPARKAYTVQLSGADGGTGEALVEIYDLP